MFGRMIVIDGEQMSPSVFKNEPVRRGDDRIVVKFSSKNLTAEEYGWWRRHLPDDEPVRGNCWFTFDPDGIDYDWLVVYDDLSPVGRSNNHTRKEPLSCPPEHTLLITQEPRTIKIYGEDFLDQFAVILTSQEPDALDHPNAVYKQVGLRWHYGKTGKGPVSYDAMRVHLPEHKTQEISAVCSAKHYGRSTLHLARIRLTNAVQEALPQLVRYGKGVRPIEDKRDALDPFRYHVTSENHIAPHYWTEKLSDAFLGLSLPFYCGCPNVTDYFPQESFIPIDVTDIPGSIEIIRKSIAENAYDKRLPELREARRRVLEEHNIFVSVAREIEARHDPGRTVRHGTTVFSRRALRHKSPAHFARGIKNKLRVKWTRTLTRW